MLLVMTVGLVVAGIVLLVVGYHDNSLGVIYAAVGCAAVAALTLVVFSLLSKRREMVTLVGSPLATASRSGRDESEEPSTGRPRAGHPDGWVEAAVVGRSAVGRAGAGAAGGTDVVDTDTAAAGESAERDDGPVFPIEDYDELGVAEIFPLIGELEPDELLEVREREVATRARGTILRRIDGRLKEAGSGATPSLGPVPAVGGTPQPGALSKPAAVAQPGPDPQLDPRRGSKHSSPSPLVTPLASNVRRPTPVPAMDRSIEVGVRDAGMDTGEPVDGVHPIPGYASMRASQILPLLVSLSPADLAAVGAAERAGANRATIISRVGRLQARRSTVDATRPTDLTPSGSVMLAPPESPAAAPTPPPSTQPPSTQPPSTQPPRSPPAPTKSKQQAPARRAARLPRVARLTGNKAGARTPQPAPESPHPPVPAGDGDPL